MFSKTPAPNPCERVHYTVYSTFTPYWGSVPGRSQAPYKPLALGLAVFFQIIPQAKGRLDIPPSQSKLRQGRGKKRVQCKPLKWAYKAVGCITEHFIWQDRTESAPHNSGTLAWPNTQRLLAFCDFLLFIVPTTPGLGGSCCNWTVAIFQGRPEKTSLDHLSKQHVATRSGRENTVVRVQLENVFVTAWDAKSQRTLSNN